MIWYRDLYISENIRRKAARVKWKIVHNAGQIDIYVLTLAANPNDQLDIIPAVQLLQKAYPKRDMVVIGLAKGYDEAIQLVCEIAEEVKRETGSLKIREYIETKNQKKGIRPWR